MSDAGRVLHTLTGQPGQYNKAGTNGVLLAKYDAQPVSAIFSVVDKPLRIAAFGLAFNGQIAVMRVWLPPSNTERTACGKLTEDGETLEKAYKVGLHSVVLNEAADEIVIDAKGHYRLIYKGDNRPDVQVVVFEDDVVTVNNTVRGIE